MQTIADGESARASAAASCTAASCGRCLDRVDRNRGAIRQRLSSMTVGRTAQRLTDIEQVQTEVAVFVMLWRHRKSNLVPCRRHSLGPITSNPTGPASLRDALSHAIHRHHHSRDGVDLLFCNRAPSRRCSGRGTGRSARGARRDHSAASSLAVELERIVLGRQPAVRREVLRPLPTVT